MEAVVEPVLDIEKSVVVADAVEEPIAKSVVLVEPLFAWIERLANGEVVLMPTNPVESNRTFSRLFIAIAIWSVPGAKKPVLALANRYPTFDGLPLGAINLADPVKVRFEGLVIAPLTVRVPDISAFPVVVAPPLIVKPPA